MDRYTGTLLDERYEILEMIGSGGMADVYKARCNRLNRLVAIKILKDDLSHDEEFKRRFYTESQAVAMLSHPNIVGVYDVSHTDSMDYIVMELIEGISLKQYMEQKKQLSWREALHFGTQIAKALEHAHSRSIIHRDIKPHNIMILKDGSVKVADFGIAQISNVQNTLTREALGSVHYISPEQAKGAHVDARSDIYSLGVVMYEMLAGRPPFDGDTPVSVAIQHINATAKPLHLLNSSVPAGLEAITMRAMSANLSNRYESATAMLADLEEFRKNPAYIPGQPTAQTANAPLSEAEQLSEKIRARSDAERAVAREDGQKKNESSRGRLAVSIGVVCIVLAFIGIGFFLYKFFLSDLFSKTAEDTVPMLIGRSYDDISPEDYPNFDIRIKAWKPSDQYEYGYIMDQTPSADRAVKVGSRIEVTVSSGENTNTMPNLVNESLQSAQTSLKMLGVSVVVDLQYESSDLYTDGYVIRTEPAAGDTLTEGQSVVLTVSQGTAAELVQVPALVGLNVEEALEKIDRAKLSRGSVLSVDSDAAKDTVTFQSIAADERVKEGTVINLQVSRGGEDALAPVIKRQSKDQTAEQGDNFTLSVRASTEDDGELTYAWYVSQTEDFDDAELCIAESKNNEAIFRAENAGTFYYFCVVTNTTKDSSAETVSDPICMIVTGTKQTVSTSITVDLPTDRKTVSVEVYVDGEMLYDPFTVDMAEAQNGTIELSVEGFGKQLVEVYANNEQVFRKMITFS